MKDYETGLTGGWLRANFNYSRSTGVFTRRFPVITYRGGIRHAAGSVAGSLHADGYIYISMQGRLYLAHRLAFLYITNRWPKSEIDHRNGIRDCNRWRNLREATTSQNRSNTLGQKSRTGPHPGVYSPAARPGTWIAQIKRDGKVHYLGVFDNPDCARAARVAAEKKYFGEFAGSAR